MLGRLGGGADEQSNGKCRPEDLGGDGVIDFADLNALLAAWGPCEECPEDLDGSGAVDFGDIVILLAAWQPCA